MSLAILDQIPRTILQSLTREPQAQASSAWMERFAAQAATLGIAAADVYAALELSPTLLPWSAAARWRADERATAERLDSGTNDGFYSTDTPSRSRL